MKFDQLIKLFQKTHKDLQAQAARSVDMALVVRNWLFGWYLVEYEQHGADRADYGQETLKNISKALTDRIGRGFSVDNLELMRRFFTVYQDIMAIDGKSETLFRISEMDLSETVSRINPVPKDKSNRVTNSHNDILHSLTVQLAKQFSLGWSHYVTLLTVERREERRFYEIEAKQNSWSVRELKRQIGASLYERLALSRDKDRVKELSEQGQLIGSADDIIKNPYILEFLNLKEHIAYSEHELESAIIDKLEHFLLELGKGFLFEARQKRFTFDDDHFYVDLVFYNRLLRCYVLIDLKRDKLTHQDLGQMQMYVNYFDRYVKTGDETPTIGIVLCHRKHDALVELTLPENSNIYTSRYQLYLPSKEELKKQVEDTIRKQGRK